MARSSLLALCAVLLAVGVSAQTVIINNNGCKNVAPQPVKDLKAVALSPTSVKVRRRREAGGRLHLSQNRESCFCQLTKSPRGARAPRPRRNPRVPAPPSRALLAPMRTYWRKSRPQTRVFQRARRRFDGGSVKCRGAAAGGDAPVRDALASPLLPQKKNGSRASPLT
jgi:hypothetical protein